jgi:RND family efflux transporter MFP subunit
MHQTVNSDEQVARAGEGSARGTAGGVSLGGIFSVVSIILFIGGLVVFGAWPRIVQQKELVSHTKTQLAEAPSVSVVMAQPGPAIQEFTLPGTTQAIQDALIYARVSGYLHARYVDIGSYVKSGQVLADIDTPEPDKQVQAAASAVKQAQSNLENTREGLAKAEADEKTAEANVRKVSADLDFFTVEEGRYKRLAGVGAVSLEASDVRTQAYQSGLANLDAMKAAARSAKAAVNAAGAAVGVAKSALNAAQAQCDQFEATRSFKKVRALFDGIVTQRNVDPGALVTSGSNTTNTVLFEIAKTDVLRILVNVPEQYLPYIHNGEKAELNFQAFPGRTFEGTITYVAGGLDSASKTLQVEIHVPNANHKLLPGMYARVHFQAPAQNRLVVLPAVAVRTRAEGNFVYTVDDNKVAHLHKVEIGRDLGGQFEIARGVKAGERAVINAPDNVYEGVKVEPVMAPVAEKADGK